MPRKNTHLTITDQFCGAGGSSQGARAVAQRVKGLEVKLALNHWKLAIETHNSNFPDTLHDCTDISACDPRRYPSTDILITSPECTNHSLAKGKKRLKATMDLFDTGKIDAAADRSRATMWDVPRFAEYHSYNIIIVENVVDARKWVMFDPWLSAMHALGYNHRCVYLNSMFCHPTPQSRDRMYVVFWKRGNKAPNLEFTPPAWCEKCGRDTYSVQTWKKPGQRGGVYGKRGQYIYCCPSCQSIVQPYYHAAFNCIDWTDIGKRIGDREKPLSDNTVRRIQYGLDKYGSEPLFVLNYNPGHTRPVRQHFSTVTGDDHHALATPFIIDDKQTTGIGFRVKGAGEQMPTVHTDPRMKVVMPFIMKAEHTAGMNVKPATEPWQTQTKTDSLGFVTPFILKQEHQHAGHGGKVRSTREAMQVQTARQSSMMISPPFLTEMYGNGQARKVSDELNTVIAGGGKTGIVTSEAWNSFIAQYYGGSDVAKHIGESLPTVRTIEAASLVSYQKPRLEDCYYRMLKPQEIKLAMAFESDYIVLGSGKDQVKQLGNAVTPPAMEFLIERCIESLK